MKRVALLGSGGVGKSRFADELGRRTGIPVIHLDQHYWKPDWVPTPKEEWIDLQVRLLSGESWIADGHYGGTLDVRLSRADTVIILTLSRWRCTWRALRRSLQYRGRAIQADGCPERIDPTFIRWVWRFPIDTRPKLDEAIARYREQLSVTELASTSAVRAFLDGLAQ